MRSRSGDVVPLRSATRAWFLISLQTFGGPAGQIAVMQRTLVDERRWIGERRFLHALSYCMLLPGPEAQQLAIYVGWLLNGTLGGLIAGVLFVLPGVVALLGLSWLYVAHGDTALVGGLFLGLAPAVLAIVMQAVLRVGKRALGRRSLVWLAAGSFVALALFGVPFPVVLLAAALLGWLLGRADPTFGAGSEHAAERDGPEPLIADHALHRATPSALRRRDNAPRSSIRASLANLARRRDKAPRSSIRASLANLARRRGLALLGFGVVLWLAPVALAAVMLGGESVLVDQGRFFAGTALVTFGGAYAVLAYVAQRAVETYGWLTGGEMVKGLAMAETTPGPLIMVVQFVAFLGAYRNPGTLDPWVAAVLASLLTTWVTFVPCFLFIFLGAPYVERLRGNHTLSAALRGITAAVVGVIANLAVYFAAHTLFARTREWGWGPFDATVPVWSSYDLTAWGIATLAAGLLFWRGWSVLVTLGWCAAVGMAVSLLG
ncbi:MAG: chromate transporter [Nocardioides sp.]